MTTLGNIFHRSPKLQDKDLFNITLLTFADINGQTYSLTPHQLKTVLEAQPSISEKDILKPTDIFSDYTSVNYASTERAFNGFIKREVVLQDWFRSEDEANEWQSKIEKMILQSRNDTRTS